MSFLSGSVKIIVVVGQPPRLFCHKFCLITGVTVTTKILYNKREIFSRVGQFYHSLLMGKRKSDTLDSEPLAPSIAVLTDSKKEAVNVAPLAKKSRVSSEANEGASGSKTTSASKAKTWQDVILEGEDVVRLM
jgi:hypothetical protein